jgi:hypothetical protein
VKSCSPYHKGQIHLLLGKLLQSELDTLHTTCHKNVYSWKERQHTLNPPMRTRSLQINYTTINFLHFIQNNLIYTSRLLPQHYIKMVGLSPRNISRLLLPVKDDWSLKSLGTYSIPCECGKVYICRPTLRWDKGQGTPPPPYWTVPTRT